jgi:hypothetical protein
MSRGDHIKVRRLGYTLHGVHVGDGNVIHYSGLAERLAGGPVEVVPKERFARGGRVQVLEHRVRYDTERVVERALSRLGEDEYHFVFRNCEHFATWAVTGRERSTQVRTAAAAVGALTLAVIGVAAVKYGPTTGSRA